MARWYQADGIAHKWHLVDSKCIPQETLRPQYNWENDERYQRRVDIYNARQSRERASIIEATEIPAWSSVPLPSKYITKMCKRCIRVAGGKAR